MATSTLTNFRSDEGIHSPNVVAIKNSRQREASKITTTSHQISKTETTPTSPTRDTDVLPVITTLLLAASRPFTVWQSILWSALVIVQSVVVKMFMHPAGAAFISAKVFAVYALFNLSAWWAAVSARQAFGMPVLPALDFCWFVLGMGWANSRSG